jgi:hypothetical protein
LVEHLEVQVHRYHGQRFEGCKRRFLVAQFGALVGASTPGKWIIAVNHIRSGSKRAGMAIPGNTPQARKAVKRDLLLQSIDRACSLADASTLGVAVLGDFNMTHQETETTATGVKRFYGDAPLTIVSGGPNLSPSPPASLQFAPLRGHGA